MTARNLLLTAHILTAIVVIGWLAMTAMVTPRLIRGGPGELAAVRWVNRTAGVLGRLAIVVFLLGIALVLRSGEDTLTFKEGWIGASMLLFVVALVNGAVFIERTEKAAIAKLEKGEAATAEAARASMLGGINMLILTVIVYLMVAKP